MKNIIKTAIISAFFAACGSTEQHLSSTETESEASSQAVALSPEQIKTAGIEIGKLSRQTIDALVHLVGTVELSPMQRASVHASAVGYIRKINLQVGNRVQKGEVVCVLEHPSYIEKQRELLETRARLPFLEAEMQRKKELQASDAGTLKNYQSAQADYQWALSHYEGLKTELQLLGFAVDKIEKENAYQSQINVVAPASGVITELFANPGKLVQPEAMICEITDISQPYIELQAFAPQLAQMREGQAVDVRVSGSGKVHSAVIERIIQEINPQTKTAMLRARLKNSDSGLVSGTPVQAEVHIPAQNEWVLAKENTFVTEQQTFAFAVENNEVRLVPIQVKSETADWVAVEADTSMQFVLKGGYYLKDRF